MADAIVQKLMSERESLESRAGAVRTNASEANRDLSGDDLSTLSTIAERVRTIDTQLEALSTSLELDVTVRDRLARLSPGSVAAGPHSYRSAGELLYDVLHQGDREARGRYESFQRAAEHMGTSAAGTVPVAGGMGGLVVSPLTGPVIDFAPSSRPFLTALGVRPLPNGISFIRPRIIDPHLYDGAGPHAGDKEKGELPSKHFDVGTDVLTTRTIGSYLNVSQELLSFVPGALDIIIGQLARRVALATEAAALTEMGKSTAKVTLAANADASATLKAIFDAAALVWETTGELPTWIAMGPKGMARLGSLVDLAGRPLLPSLGAGNAIGTASADAGVNGVAGLSPVITHAIANAEFFIGNGAGLEAYEYRFPTLEAVEPSVLGRQVAVASAVAFYRPTTKEAVTGTGAAPAEGNGVVKVGA